MMILFIEVVTFTASQPWSERKLAYRAWIYCWQRTAYASILSLSSVVVRCTASLCLGQPPGSDSAPSGNSHQERQRSDGRGQHHRLRLSATWPLLQLFDPQRVKVWGRIWRTPWFSHWCDYRCVFGGRLCRHLWQDRGPKCHLHGRNFGWACGWLSVSGQLV